MGQTELDKRGERNYSKWYFALDNYQLKKAWLLSEQKYDPPKYIDTSNHTDLVIYVAFVAPKVRDNLRDSIKQFSDAYFGTDFSNWEDFLPITNIIWFRTTTNTALTPEPEVFKIPTSALEKIDESGYFRKDPRVVGETPIEDLLKYYPSAVEMQSAQQNNKKAIDETEATSEVLKHGGQIITQNYNYTTNKIRYVIQVPSPAKQNTFAYEELEYDGMSLTELSQLASQISGVPMLSKDAAGPAGLLLPIIGLGILLFRK